MAIVGMTMVILLLPVSETTQGQLLSFLGIVISASVALSSGSLVGNAMGGITMRLGVSKMNVGDLIVVGEHTHIPVSRRTPPPTGDAELAAVQYERASAALRKLGARSPLAEALAARE